MDKQLYVKPFVLTLVLALFAPLLTVPVVAQPPSPGAPMDMKRVTPYVSRDTDPGLNRLDAAAVVASASRTLLAEEVVVQANGTYTWTQDTQANWEQGIPENLDSTTISGSLQLERRWFTENTSVTPREQLASGQISPDVVADADGNLYAVWVDRRETNSDLYFAWRPQGGTWSANIRVNDVPGSVSDYKARAWSQEQPAIALDDAGNLYAVWIDERSGRKDVYFATRPSGGAWSANERVNDDKYVEIECWMPDLVVTDDETVHVAWTDMRSGESNVYSVARSPAGTWSANVRINDDADRAWQGWVSLGIDDTDTLYAVWGDSRNGDDGIYFAQRSPGTDWGQNELVGDEPEGIGQYRPKMAVTSAGKVYVVWYDYRTSKTDIYFSERLGAGAWSAGVRVNQATTGWQEQSDITVDGLGNIHVFWKDFNSGAWYGARASGLDLYHAYRAAGNSSWSAAELVNDRDCGGAICLGYVSDMYCKGYAVTADDAGNVYALWSDVRHQSWDIYFNHRPVGGTWQTNIRVNDDSDVNQGEPALVEDAANLDLVWETWSGWPSIYNIYHAEHWDGSGWNTTGRVNDEVEANQSAPALAVDTTGTLHALWVDCRDSPAQVYYAQRLPDSVWQTDERVTDADGSAGGWQGLSVAADADGNTYAIWQDSRNTDDYGDIYFAKRDATIGTWSANVKVNDDPGAATQSAPDIAVDGAGNTYAVWQDRRNASDYGDIYFARRDATTGAWDANVKLNDDPGTAVQSEPRLSVDDSGHVYVVWEDRRDGNAQVYFANRPAGGEWSANVRVSPDYIVRFPTYTGDASIQDPTVAADSTGQVYVAWSSGANWVNDVLLAVRSPDGTWTPARKVSDSWEVLKYGSSLVVDAAGKVSLVWEDGRHGAPNLYFAQSLDVPVYVPQGTYTSLELDTGVSVAAWDSLAYSATLPSGTALAFETRSRRAGGVWSVWTVVENGEIASPPAQFLQYRVSFSSTLESASPLLDWVKVAYRSAGTPSAPRFVTPCGVTNQLSPTVEGVATADSVIHLSVDGSEVSTTTVGADGLFSVTPELTAGAHSLSAVAENTSGEGPSSASLALTVDSDLSYDPIGVRAGQWSRGGWLLAPPRDSNGCANLNNEWRVWPRANQKFHVEVPVTYTTSAAVTVTLGTQVITLTEWPAGLFVGVFQPPIQGGDFVIEVNVDGQTTTVDGGPVLIDPDGFVYEATGTISDTIPGVEVTCYYSDTHAGQWVMWDAWNYSQVNPQTTLDDGYFSFYTPAGTYHVVAEKEAYPTYTSPDLVVVSTPVRHNIALGNYKIYLPLVLR